MTRSAMLEERTLRIEKGGKIRFIYDDDTAAVFTKIGKPQTVRASHIEPAADGQRWVVDLTPVGGPLMPPVDTYAAAVSIERAWLTAMLITGGIDGYKPN